MSRKKKCAQCADPRLKGLHTCSKKKPKKPPEDKFGDRDFYDHEQPRYFYDEEGKLCEGEDIAIINVEDDLSINPHDLDGEMLVQAKLLGWYGQLEEEVMAAKKRAKARWLDLVEDICDEIRVQEEDNDTPVGKRLKESDLKRRANRNEDVREAIAEYMTLSSKQRAISSYLRALTERGRMLQSMNKKQANEHHQTR